MKRVQKRTRPGGGARHLHLSVFEIEFLNGDELRID